MRILIIEDDQRLARLITQVLKETYFAVDVAHDGDAGLELALTGAHQVAIIDWMLPKRDGLAICRAVRTARVPLAILMLTALTQVEDRVIGLDSGADDYLTKPFAFEELVARVRALSRRFDLTGSDVSELRRGDIALDLRAHTGRRAEVALDLTDTEWNLLECFMHHAGQAMTREQIFNQVWGFDSDAQLTMVDVYISYLRHKLSVVPGHTDPIETVRGTGYRFKLV
jgi:two-component system OmpR family response regulator